MKKDNWKLWNLQLVIAFKKLNNNFKEIPQILKDIFDGRALMLPIPDDAPREIPRITIGSNDDFKIEISNERISIFFENKKSTEECDDQSHKTKLKKKVENLLSLLSVEINWVGLILRNINENNEANENMKKMISNSSIFSLETEDSDLLLKFHEKRKLTLSGQEYSGDLIVELGSNVRKTDTDEQIGNFFMLDMNTRKTINQNYDIKILNELIDEVFSQQDNYFANLAANNEQ